MEPDISTIRPMLAVTAALILLLFLAIAIFVIRERDVAETFEEEMKHAGGCHNKDLAYRDPKLPVEMRIQDLMDRMTTEEKIGQLILVDKNSIKDISDIQEYGIGAMLSGGGEYPEPNTPDGWRRMLEDFEFSSGKECLGIPLLYGVDAVHGNGILPTATIFPQSIGLGAANDPQLVEEVAAATAQELAAIGIYWNFFPSLDVVKDTRWGRTYETFGSDTQKVVQLGQAYLEGFQSGRYSGVAPMATPKHYVGLGAQEWETSDTPGYQMDHGNVNIGEGELRSQHLPPFEMAVQKGALCIMTGLNRWHDEKMSGNRHLLTEILKEDLDFRGFVVSDWQGASDLAPDECESWIKAVNAGVDMVMLPSEYKKFVSCMKDAAWRGDISDSRLDDAVRRILRAKFSMGLFDRVPMILDDKTIGSQEHRELARRAVRKSLVLLKNNNDAFPISKDAPHILVAGSAADNLGRQAGGWTVEWQGIDGNQISGTTILEGIRKAVSPDSRVDYKQAGDFDMKGGVVDLGIAVVGEKPYAEGIGDSEHPALSDEDIEAINRLRRSCRKIIVVIVSGRPLDIKEPAKNWDGIVAAWLPGSEGEGISDVLFGDYPFVGTLPVEWRF